MYKKYKNRFTVYDDINEDTKKCPLKPIGY